MTNRFIFFDLGKVLLSFDHALAGEHLQRACGVDAQRANEALYETDRFERYERGELSSQDYYAEVCADCGAELSFAEFAAATGQIFELNVPIVPIVSQLRHAGYCLGILSNTSDIHWQAAGTGKYALITDYFTCHCLSFRLGQLKPDAAIYAAAAAEAGKTTGSTITPDKIFFVDDREDNVQGAREAGWDAVQYQNPQILANELRKRDFAFNY